MYSYQVTMKAPHSDILEFTINSEHHETITHILNELEKLNYKIGEGEDLSPPELQGKI